MDGDGGMKVGRVLEGGTFRDPENMGRIGMDQNSGSLWDKNCGKRYENCKIRYENGMKS